MGTIPTVEIEVDGKRKIVNADDPRAKGVQHGEETLRQEEGRQEEVTGVPTKSQIATMKKADVIEWLEAHGVEGPEGTVAELRDTLRATIYMEG